jgi:hypothetical protein
VVDLAQAFERGHDLVGKRARSLDLYGLDQHVREHDPFVVALQRVVTSAAYFTDSAGASVVVWRGDEPTELASTGRRLLDDHDVVLRRGLDRLAGEPSTTVLVTRTGGNAPVTVIAAAVVGHEHAVLGTVAAWRSGGGPVAPQQVWLVDQLANAAVHALDQRRRVLARRDDSPTTPLRVVRERRRSSSGHD